MKFFRKLLYAGSSYALLSSIVLYRGRLSGGQLQRSKPQKQEVGKLPFIKKCYKPASGQIRPLSKNSNKIQEIAREEINSLEENAFRKFLSALDYPEIKKRSIGHRNLFTYSLIFLAAAFAIVFSLLKS